MTTTATPRRPRAASPETPASTPAATAKPAKGHPKGPDGWERTGALYPLVWARTKPIVGSILDVDVVQLGQGSVPEVAIVLATTEPTEVIDLAEPTSDQKPRAVPANSIVRVTGTHLQKLRALSGGAEPDARLAIVRIECHAKRDHVWISPESTTRAAAETAIDLQRGSTAASG